MVIGRQHQAVDAFFHQTVNGSKLGLQVKFHPFGDSGKSIVLQFFRFVLHAGHNLIKKWVMLTEQNHTDLIFFLLSSQCKPGPVGAVIQCLDNLHNLLGCLWIDSTSVIQYPIYSSAGYARQVGNLLDSSHEMPPKNSLY